MESTSFNPAAFSSSGFPSMSNGSLPPQIFGNFAPDSSLLGAPLAQDFLYDGSEDFNFDPNIDSTDPKRRRIARACDACRKKKIKCDGKAPACSHCQNYKTECIFTHVEKKRNPPKGAKYIEGLENRLGRMEALLKMSGLLNREEEGGGTDLGTLEQRLAHKQTSSPSAASGHSRMASTSVPGSSPHPDHSQSPANDVASPEEVKQEPQRSQSEHDVEALSELMCSLVTNNQGDTKYIGSSSGFSIFSPRGIQWVSEKTGDGSFGKMIEGVAQDDNKWFHWRPEIFGDIFDYKVYQPLPSREECYSLLNDYFVGLNKVFPLFHEPTFLWLVDKQYTDDPYRGSGWWASLNVALAIAYRIRVMKNLGRGDEESKGWAYFKNALAVQPELTLRNTDLLSVQALIGMTLFMQGTPNPQPSFQLASAAVRLSHEVGLHKRGSSFGLNPTEIEQRKRVFWIAYMIDKDICLRSGRPPAQDDDDWNVDLPSEEPEDGVGLVTCADGKTKINLFRQFCKFAVIQSKAYNRLYSVKASKQSDGELLNTIGELDLELEQWKDEIPMDFRPECEIHAGDESLMMQVVTLHFAYYNVLATIHRMAIHHGVWTDRLSEYAIKGLNVRPLNPRVYCSAALCVSAARASINLIKYIPPGDYALVWMILYYPVSSLVTLFANTLQNPQDPRARPDLKLISIVVTFLSQIGEDDESGSIRRMFTVCKEFHRIANVVVKRAEHEMTARQKRKQEREREKVEKTLEEPELPTTKQAQAQAQAQQENHKRPADDMLDQAIHQSAISNAAGGVPTVDFSDMSNQNPGFSPDLNNPVSDPIKNNAPWMADAQSSPAFTNSSSNNNNSSSLNPNDPTFSFNTPSDHSTPLNVDSFQQPFLPQDLWSMPMTFEWDLADMTNSGIFDDPSRGGGQGYQPQQF